jgi:hypothetical protein
MNLLLENKGEKLISCCYINATSRSKIIRISNLSELYLEKVVLPGSKLYFQSIPEAFLEVNSNDIISSVLEDRIPCSYLKI